MSTHCNTYTHTHRESLRRINEGLQRFHEDNRQNGHLFESMGVRIDTDVFACASDERWGAGVEYHFQEFNEPYAPS